MYVTEIKISRDSSPDLLGRIYNTIAKHYHLPFHETLTQRMKTDNVNWPMMMPEKTEIYFLEYLLDDQLEKNVFQIRFKAHEKARSKTSIFLSVAQGEVHNISIQFPAKTRHAASQFISILKSFQSYDIDFEIEGLYEDVMDFMREKSLSSFKWYDRLGRYLHKFEKLENIKEVREGKL